MSQIQLLARGIQDVWLSGEPQVSFYRSNMKRHTPFGLAIEQFTVAADGKIVINTKSDLLGYTYLTAYDKTTGALAPNPVWSNIISTVELVIGNQIIAIHDLTYINTIQKVLESDTYSKRSQTPAFQPLGFFFDRQVLPLVALKYTDVKINITWNSTTAVSQYIYRCWSHCIRLGEDESRFFANRRHQMLIPQLQRQFISSEPAFSGPLKYIAAPCVNYSTIYKPASSAGIAQWAARIGGTGAENGTSISVDGSGNSYATGTYASSPVTIYNADTSTFGTLTNSGSLDVFIVKYNTSGTTQWATRIAGTGNDTGLGISVDGSGNSYVTGYYASSPVTIYNADMSTFGTLTNSGSDDAFIVKYDTSGTAQWATRIGGTGSDTGYSISVDGSGNSYVTGRYLVGPITIYNADTSTFGTLTSSGGFSDVFIVKYNTSGTAQWATRIGGTGGEAGYGISVDSSGNSYVTGYYNSNPVTIYNADTSTFGTLANAGLNDAFIVKYDVSGTAQWATRIAGTGSENSLFGEISVDGSGNSYVTGTYASSPVTIYNADTSTFGTLTNSGIVDVFIVKYNTSGTAQWAARIGGTGNDTGYSISVDGSGNSYVTGRYASNPVTIYNADTSTFGTLTNSGVSSDAFIVKYNVSGTAQWATRIAGTGNDDNGNSISVDGSGNSYVTGYYNSSPVTIYNADTSTFGTLTNSGSYDAFIVKYG